MAIQFLSPFFHWCYNTFLGVWVRSGEWQFPLIETIHILALALMIGVIVVVDLRMMGVMMRGWTLDELAGELMPYFNWSVVAILITGTLLYLSEAIKAYENPAFWVKVYLLIPALLFHYLVVTRVTKHADVSRGLGWTVGLTSLILWVGVGWAGRAIGFV